MRRGVIIALSVLGVLVVVLLVAVATVGSGLDQARIERDDLEWETDELQRQVEALTGERDELRQQVEQQSSAMERWKAELEHRPADSSDQPVGAEAPSP